MGKLVFNPDIWIEDADDAQSIKPWSAAPKPPIAPNLDRFQAPNPKGRPAASQPRPIHGKTGSDYIAALLDVRLSEMPIPPCFPDAVVKIHDALKIPGRSVDEFVKLVETEPRLAEILLQVANVASFGTGVNRVSDLRSAITRLGQPLIQGAAVMFAVQQMKDQLRLRSIAAPLSELWRESRAVACICQVIARRTAVKTELAFLTGLLHGIGYLYIVARALGKSAALGHDLVDNPLIAERHAAIGAAALADWQASKQIADAVRDQNDHARLTHGREHADLTDVLIVSIVLARALKQARAGSLQLDGITSFAALGLTTDDCLETIRHAEYQLASLLSDWA